MFSKDEFVGNGYFGMSYDNRSLLAGRKPEITSRDSEELFRLLVESVQDYAIFMLDPFGNVVSWNLGAERIKGYSADEIIGKHFSIFYPREDVENEKPKKELKAAAASGRFEDEGYRVRKDGSRFWANVIITALFDGRGKLRGYSKVSRDITQQRKAEQALRDQARIMDLVNDAIFLRDLDDRVVYWNKGAEKVYGFKQEEALGRVTHDLLKTKFPRPLPEIRAKLLSEDHWEGEIEHCCHDGRALLAASSWTLQRDSKDQPVAIIELNYDITERKRIEQAIQEKNVELLNAAESKNRFLANMSHELRTPLNGIIGFAEFLSDGKPGPLNAKQKEYLNDILNSGRHLLQLINDVLDLAKVEANKMELRPEKFSLAKAVGGVCAVARPMAQKKCLQVQTGISVDLDEVVLDEQRFKQVLYNLVSNAIKFTDEGGQVEINARRRDDDHFILTVRDTGIGIAPRDLPRLFTEFEQLESGASRRYEGTGLGLALTRRMVELQGGTIGVESEPGKGSTFSVVLPLRGGEP
jgi:PAS domain S-box-containing protein